MEEIETDADRFSAFLRGKNINPQAFAEAEPQRFSQWQQLFAQMSEPSFVLYQKFHLNPVRRRFPLIPHPALL